MDTRAPELGAARCSAKRSQRRFSSSDSLDDAVRVGGPDEGLWAFVCLHQEAIDCRLEIDNAAEDAAPEPLVGQLGEEAFDRVEPRG